MTYQQRSLLEYLVNLGEQGTTIIPKNREETVQNLRRNGWATCIEANGFTTWYVTDAGRMALKRWHVEKPNQRASPITL